MACSVPSPWCVWGVWPDAAALEALESIEEDDQTARLRFNRGMILQQLSRFDEAAQVCAAALAGRLLLVVRLRGSPTANPQRQALIEACDMDPHFAVPRAQLAAVYYKQQYFAEVSTNPARGSAPLSP